MEKKKNNVVLGIILLVIAINIVTVLMAAFENNSAIGYILTVVVCAEHLFVIYYALFGYKKPHGNLLRYVMIIFAISLGAEMAAFTETFATIEISLYIATLIIIPYIAGRLNKIEQNKVLITLTFVLLFISTVIAIINDKPQSIIDYLRNIGVVFEWFAISAAYFVRYKEHKEAGLMDAPKE